MPRRVEVTVKGLEVLSKAARRDHDAQLVRGAPSDRQDIRDLAEALRESDARIVEAQSKDGEG